MKHILIAIMTVPVMTVSAFAQRGGNDDNPYAKIYTETHPGKRTARCLKNLLPPDDKNGSFYASPCNDYADISDTRIKQFQEFIAFFAASAKDEKQMKTAEKFYNENGCKKELEQINFHAGFIEKQGTFTGDKITPVENLLCKAKGSLQSLKCIKAYLEGVKKIFPAIPQADEAISKANEILQQYAGNTSILASIKRNLGAALAEVYFPKAVATNAEWEGWFKNHFSKNYPGYTFLRQSLLSSQWYVKKNEISGLPEYRQMGAAVGAKAPDGKCRIIKIDVYQDYLGGKFDASRFKEYSNEEISCENLK